MKSCSTAIALALILVSTIANAGPLDPACTAKKATKSAAMKATVGVGGRCDAKEATADTAKESVGIEDKKGINKKDKHVNKDKDDKELVGKTTKKVLGN